MRILAPLLCAMFAAAAVVLHLPWVAPPPGTSDFVQGAYRPVIEAESLLEAGRRGQALEAFEVAAMRATRCGRISVFVRIRNRVGRAGLDLAGENPQEGWPFLSWYALTGPDLSLSSRMVENWMLSHHPEVPPVFEYEIIEAGGKRTCLGQRPMKAPLHLYRRLSPNRKLNRLPGCLYSEVPSSLPQDASISWTYPVNARSWSGHRDSELRCEGNPIPGGTLYVSLNQITHWDLKIDAQALPSTIRIPGRVLYWHADRLLFCGPNSLFPPDIRVLLVHRYATLKLGEADPS